MAKRRAPLELQLLGRMLLHSALVGAAAGLACSVFFGALELAQRVILEELTGYVPLRAQGEHILHAIERPTFRPWLLWVVPAIGEDTWTIAGSQNRNVRVIVVDVDRYGLQLVKDLHTVFPSMKIVALTNDPRRLAQAVRAGAAVAVPRSTPPADVAKLIRRLTRR